VLVREEQSLEIGQMLNRRGHDDEDVLVGLAQRALLGTDEWVIEGAQKEKREIYFEEHVVPSGQHIVVIY
jgi:hypothetical protein